MSSFANEANFVSEDVEKSYNISEASLIKYPSQSRNQRSTFVSARYRPKAGISLLTVIEICLQASCSIYIYSSE